jgi:hypothetical protein
MSKFLYVPYFGGTADYRLFFDILHSVDPPPSSVVFRSISATFQSEIVLENSISLVDTELLLGTQETQDFDITDISLLPFSTSPLTYTSPFDGTTKDATIYRLQSVSLSVSNQTTSGVFQVIQQIRLDISGDGEIGVLGNILTANAVDTNSSANSRIEGTSPSLSTNLVQFDGADDTCQIIISPVDGGTLALEGDTSNLPGGTTERDVTCFNYPRLFFASREDWFRGESIP